MNVNWDWYRRRRKIDLLSWKKENGIQTYSDFLEILRGLDIGPVPPTHPDLVVMEITGGPTAREILENAKIQETPPPGFGMDDDIDQPDSTSTGKSSPDNPAPLPEKEVSSSKESPSKKEKLPPGVAWEEPPPGFGVKDLSPMKEYKKSELSKMKKADLLDICNKNNISLPGSKNTKNILIQCIMQHQDLK